MSIEDEYNGCIRKAFDRRRAARKELDTASQQARAVGLWLRIVADHLVRQSPCQVVIENGALVFRTSTPPHLLLHKTEDGAPPPVSLPSADDLAQLLNQITSLEAEIAVLTKILDD